MRRICGRALARVLGTFVLALGAGAAHGQECRVLDAGLVEFFGHDCRNGLAHGHGFAKGEASYLGEFAEGRRHGRGEAVYPDGTRYDGEWERGQRHGRGILKRQDGTTYDGEWKDNARLNGVETTAAGKTITYANGAMVVAAAPQPVVEDPLAGRREACVARADSCETACAVGALAGALLSRGKSDGNRENAECAARCEATKQSCLAAIAPGSPQAPATTAETAPGGTARRFCAPKSENWCMHDRLVDAPAYAAFKKACPLLVSKFDTFSSQYTIEAVGDSEEALRGNIARFEQETRAQVREYLRDHAVLSRCILESGLLQFRREGGHYFRMHGYTFNVRRFPRSVWDTAVRHTQSQHAKGMSTMVFEPANQYPAEYEKYLALEKECGIGAPVSPYYPRAWWEETLAYLDKTIREADQRGFKQPQRPKELLKTLQCHKQRGWPLAAESQFYVLYKGGRDRADR